MLIDSGHSDHSQPESGIAPNPDVPAPQQHPALLVKNTASWPPLPNILSKPRGLSCTNSWFPHRLLTRTKFAASPNARSGSDAAKQSTFRCTLRAFWAFRQGSQVPPYIRRILCVVTRRASCWPIQDAWAQELCHDVSESGHFQSKTSRQ